MFHGSTRSPNSPSLARHIRAAVQDAAAAAVPWRSYKKGTGHGTGSALLVISLEAMGTH